MNGKMGDFRRAYFEMPPLSDFIPGFIEALRKAGADKGPDFPADEETGLQILSGMAMTEWERLRRSEVWLNDVYQVAIDKNPRHNFPGMTLWQLEIKRIDREPCQDWLDIQAIKNQLCGVDVEAIELYPNEARLATYHGVVQRHLWAFMHQKSIKGKGVGKPIIPLGFQTRFTTSHETIGAKQIPAPANDRDGQ